MSARHGNEAGFAVEEIRRSSSAVGWCVSGVFVHGKFIHNVPRQGVHGGFEVCQGRSLVIIAAAGGPIVSAIRESILDCSLAEG